MGEAVATPVLDANAHPEQLIDPRAHPFDLVKVKRRDKLGQRQANRVGNRGRRYRVAILPNRGKWLLVGRSPNLGTDIGLTNEPSTVVFEQPPTLRAGQ